jgi:hypothetical protein
MLGNRHLTGFRGPSPAVGKATQFRPGQSGNPSGRPKEVFSRWIRHELESLDTTGKTQIAQKIAKVLVRKAMRGDLRAIQLILDRMEGRIPSGELGRVETGPFRAVVEHIGRRPGL